MKDKNVQSVAVEATAVLAKREYAQTTYLTKETNRLRFRLQKNGKSILAFFTIEGKEFGLAFQVPLLKWLINPANQKTKPE